jgi:hypothetical protein
MANLLIALAQVLDYLLWAYWWILLGRVVISWVNADLIILSCVSFILRRSQCWPECAAGCRFTPVGSIYRQSSFGSGLSFYSVF